MQTIYERLYKPDVLSCLADLSNDEVFTPPDIANKMLDLLPQELFKNKETKILDPACKSGVILREAAKRFIEGERDQFDSLQECIDWVFHNQIYGIAITELTSLLSRRSVYCSKYPNSPFSITKFEPDDAQGNILFHRIQHTWEGLGTDKHCIFCGASAKTMERGSDLETHAYEFVHTYHPEEIFGVKFDVIISNPPYQLETGGGTEEKKSATQAKPIYHKFVEQAKKLNPRYISMIIPARWYNGGMGLNKFRNDMLNDKSLVRLVDYNNSKDCFQGVDIAGGVCYFLWDRENPSEKCEITNITGDGTDTTVRSLSQFGDFFVRANNTIPIINKVLSKAEHFMNETVSAYDTFGLPTSEHGHSTYKPGDMVLIHSKGYNGQAKSYIERSRITKNIELLDKFKVKISRMIPQGGEVGIKPENGYRSISTPHILQKNEVDTFSYLNVGFFDTLEEATNLRDYLCCKFTRFMIRTTYSGVNVSQSNFCFAPVMDMHRHWTDQELYKYFSLTEAEISLIERTMRPMDDISGGDDDA